MKYLLLSLILFVLSVMIHIWLHRLLIVRHINTFKTTGVFLVGFLINAIVQLSLFRHISEKYTIWTMPLPIASIVFFGLITAVYCILFSSAFLKDLSPSFLILKLLRLHNRLTKSEIEHYFTDQNLIYKRLEQLETARLIKKRAQVYVVLAKGIFVCRIIETYRRFLSWHVGG